MVIVDDHQMVIEGLKAMLSPFAARVTVVGEALGVDEALEDEWDEAQDSEEGDESVYERLRNSMRTERAFEKVAGLVKAKILKKEYVPRGA